MDKATFLSYLLEATPRFEAAAKGPAQPTAPIKLSAKEQQMKDFLEGRPFGCNNSNAVKFAEILLGKPLGVVPQREEDDLINFTGLPTTGAVVIGEDGVFTILSGDVNDIACDNCVQIEDGEVMLDVDFRLSFSEDRMATESEIRTLVDDLPIRKIRVIAAYLNLE